MSIKINFVDAQVMHKKYLNTFEVPSKEDLHKLIVGYIVKVAVDNERFWVSVIDINRDKITAVVKNYLLTLPFSYGNLITFELKNVHGISLGQLI